MSGKWSPAYKLTHKEYIGDGVYASFDGYQMWLTTERGTKEYPDVHIIALEPAVFDRLVHYYRKIYEPGTNHAASTPTTDALPGDGSGG